MAYKEKYEMIIGEMFRNEDFSLTEEYFEMIHLWNKLNEDPDFDLPGEVLSGKSEAIRLWELFTIANDIHIGELEKEKRKKVSKRGPQRYSTTEKLRALLDWDALDKNISPVTLREFLERRFGEEGGIPLVAESTFHGWRQQLKRDGKYNNT